MNKEPTESISAPKREKSSISESASAPFLNHWVSGRIRSFICAGRGLFVLCLRERNFQIHLVAALLAIGLGFYFRLSSNEWLLLVLTISMVFVAETLNTALERVVDLVQPERHPLARDAKDLAAAAVLVASLGAVVIGLILFLPRIWPF